MATHSSTVGQGSGSIPRAIARNAVIFLIGHALFRGNEVLWIVLAALVGTFVGASGMWLFRHAHDGPVLDVITRPGGLTRFRDSARACHCRRW